VRLRHKKPRPPAGNKTLLNPLPLLHDKPLLHNRMDDDFPFSDEYLFEGGEHDLEEAFEL
jgi:hypothetical protein